MHRRKKMTKRQFSLVVIDRNSIFDSLIRTISVAHTDADDGRAGLVVVRGRNSTACTTNEDRNSLRDVDTFDGHVDDDDDDDDEKFPTIVRRDLHVEWSVGVENWVLCSAIEWSHSISDRQDWNSRGEEQPIHRYPLGKDRERRSRRSLIQRKLTNTRGDGRFVQLGTVLRSRFAQGVSREFHGFSVGFSEESLCLMSLILLVVFLGHENLPLDSNTHRMRSSIRSLQSFSSVHKWEKSTIDSISLVFRPTIAGTQTTFEKHRSDVLVEMFAHLLVERQTFLHVFGAIRIGFARKRQSAHARRRWLT